MALWAVPQSCHNRVAMPTILCADDDPLFQRFYNTLFVSKGYESVICSNGAEVIDRLDDDPAPDLFILDLDMPSVNGLEACQAIRKRPNTYRAPVIIVSGMSAEETIEQALTIGADDYILKPFQTSEILAKVRFLIRKNKGPVSGLGLKPGARFLGRYEVLRELGAGGYSTVFMATDMDQDPPRSTALKVYDVPQFSKTHPNFMSILLREAFHLSRIQHPAVVELYDFGNADKCFFLALEYVDGQSLQDYVEQVGPLDQEHLVYVLHEVTSVLKYLDDMGFIHRDIKPSNILMRSDGHIKIVDFGLTRRRDEGTISLSDEFKGTPQYVCPEYIMGEDDLDIRSDIYSLGATLYFAATGNVPFTGASTLEILNNHFKVLPPPVMELCPHLDPTFSALIDVMMSIHVDDRCDLSYIFDCISDIRKNA